MRSVTAVAYARAGLLGNPSDIYGGRVLAFTFQDMAARVDVRDAPHVELGDLRAASVREAVSPATIARATGASALMAAAARKLADHAPRLLTRSRGFRLTLTTDIPRQAGLAGSSAIVIATLRALAGALDVELERDTMATLALAAETEVLGITAGPMDRVVQAHEGVLFMDFGPGGAHERLDPAALPPLFVAWDPRPGQDSGAVHDRVRPRWERGEPEVVAAVRELATLADAGVDALRRGAVAELGRLVDRSFAVRAAVWPLCARDGEMVAIAGRLRAPAKLCGSGGAIVGVLANDGQFVRLEATLRAAGYRALRPRVGPGRMSVAHCPPAG